MSNPLTKIGYAGMLALGVAVGTVSETPPVQSEPHGCYAPDIFVQGSGYKVILNFDDPTLVDDYGKDKLKEKVEATAKEMMLDLYENRVNVKSKEIDDALGPEN